MTMYIGLDVHARNTVYVVQDSEGRKDIPRKLP